MKISTTLQSTNMAENEDKGVWTQLHKLNFLNQRLTTHAVNDPEGNTCPQLTKFCLGGQKHTRDKEKGFLSTPKWLPISTIQGKLFLILVN